MVHCTSENICLHVLWFLTAGNNKTRNTDNVTTSYKVLSNRSYKYKVSGVVPYCTWIDWQGAGTVIVGHRVVIVTKRVMAAALRKR